MSTAQTLEPACFLQKRSEIFSECPVPPQVQDDVLGPFLVWTLIRKLTSSYTNSLYRGGTFLSQIIRGDDDKAHMKR